VPSACAQENKNFSEVQIKFKFFVVYMFHIQNVETREENGK